MCPLCLLLFEILSLRCVVARTTWLAFLSTRRSAQARPGLRHLTDMLCHAHVVASLYKEPCLHCMPLSLTSVPTTNKPATHIACDMLQHGVDGQHGPSIELLGAGPPTQPAPTHGKHVFYVWRLGPSGGGPARAAVYSTYPVLRVHFDPQLLSFILIKSDRPLPLQETR